MIEVSSGFKLTVKGDCNGPKLLNKWVFQADLHGINVNKITFKASGGCSQPRSQTAARLSAVRPGHTKREEPRGSSRLIL